MGLFSRLKSIDGFSQRPLQEKGGNSSNLERLQTSSMTSTLSFNENLKSIHSNKGNHSGRRASEATRSISASSSSSTSSTGIHSHQIPNMPRPKSALPKTQMDQTMDQHLPKKSITNPNTQSQYPQPQPNTIGSVLPISFQGFNSDQENIQPSPYASTSQTSLIPANDQRKGSSGSNSSFLNVNGVTAGSSVNTIEGEIVEKSTFPTSGSLVTSSLRLNDHDSPRLFNNSWHSPNPSSSFNFGAKFSNSSTMEYDDEGLAEEIADDVQSNDTMYATMNASLYSNRIDTTSRTSLNKGSLGANSLRKASSRLKNGLIRSTKRPSTADASLTSGRPSLSWDSTRRRGSHTIFQISSSEERKGGSDFRLGLQRRSTDSLTSTISIGSRDTMTRTSTIIPSNAVAVNSNLPSLDRENIKNEDSFPSSSRQRARASSSTSSHSIRAVIRASLSRPTSRGGLQNNQQSSSPLVSPKSQIFEFGPQNSARAHSPTLNSHSLPSQQQQQRSSQARQRLLADQAGAFTSDQERIDFKNPGFEKVSLSPAPRKRSKSRTSRTSNECEKSFENPEPVPEIPSQYRDERRSSIATTFFNSEDNANESTLSSEDCDSIDQKSINDEIPGFRTSISTTATTSVQQHTPQSSISGTSSMAHLRTNNDKQFIGPDKIHESLMQNRNSLSYNQQRESDEISSHPPSSWKTQTIDSKFQLLTPESFSSASRTRLREIQDLSSSALKLNSL